MRPAQPYLSVVVPAHNGTAVLPRTLAGLAASELPREAWELIVVDDASGDATAELAAGAADVVIRLGGKPHGPSYARNRGFEVCRGEVVVFVDADVVVHPATLRQFADAFLQDPELSAVFGSYDDRPPAPGFTSQYRNLLHHYVHQQNPGPAETFWAGCGAIRSEVFRAVGMYNEWHYARPQIEDIELGHRMTDQGYRIELRPEIQATHLKAWTLANVIRTDLTDRGVPWTRLLIGRGAATRSKSLNLRTEEKVKTALVGLALVGLAVALFRWETRWLLVVAALLTPVVVGSAGLYRFFWRRRGLFFAVRVVPLHLLYYVLNGVAVGWGWLLYHLIGDPQPPAEVQAMAEMGVQQWPPVPRRVPEPATGPSAAATERGRGVT